MLTLSFSGHSCELYEIIGRDTFLSALNDPGLRIRVLDQQPMTLDQALAIACRIEAYSAGGSADGSVDDAGRRRVRVVNGGAAIDENDRIRRLERQIAEQKEALEALRCRDVTATDFRQPYNLASWPQAAHVCFQHPSNVCTAWPVPPSDRSTISGNRPEVNSSLQNSSSSSWLTCRDRCSRRRNSAAQVNELLLVETPVPFVFRKVTGKGTVLQEAVRHHRQQTTRSQKTTVKVRLNLQIFLLSWSQKLI